MKIRSPKTIKSKLGLGAGFLFFIAFVFGAVTVHNTQVMEQLYNWGLVAGSGKERVHKIGLVIHRMIRGKPGKEFNYHRDELKNLILEMDSYLEVLRSGYLTGGITPTNFNAVFVEFEPIEIAWAEKYRPMLSFLLGIEDQADIAVVATMEDELHTFYDSFTQQVDSGLRVVGRQIHDEIREMRTANALFFILLGTTLFFALRLVQRTLSRMTVLKKEAEFMGKGDFDRRVDDAGQDEIAQLATTFNAMAGDLKQTTVSRDYINNIINSMTDALFVLNSYGHVESTNNAAQTVSGYSQVELNGLPFNDLIIEEGVDSYVLNHVKEYRYMRPTERPLRNKEGKLVPCLLSGAVMEGPNGSSVGIVLVAKDISEMKTMQAEIEKERSKAVSASKMASLGEMAGGVAHEINNPLAIISGYTEQVKKVLKREPIDHERIENTLEKINRSVDRIARIVRGLKAFSRDGSKDPFRKIQAKTIIEDVLELSSTRFKNNNIELRVELPSEELSLECRSVEVSQVLVNCLNNARHAVEKLEDKWVALEAKDMGESVEFSVIDAGSGIPEEIRAKILQPFFTTKEVGSGTGLGLSISKGIVESHHGKLWIDPNCPNTRFVMTLPKKQKQEAILHKKAAA